MTHRLTVLRHAQADGAPAGGEDFDRPLSPQGIAAARALGAVLASRLEVPSQVHVSPSLRTRQTAELVCGAAYPRLVRRVVQALYLADVDVLLGQVAQTPEDCRHLMLVGHNPGLSELWSRVGDEAGFEALSPGDWRSRELSVARWSDLATG